MSAVVASISVTWVTTRAAGYTAFALLTASVALGLVVSSRLRSSRWPRFATTELHRFVTLLTLVFIAVHVLVAMLDRFISFRLIEVLVPFTSHYRPLWTGLGIVSAYLAAAVWASSWLQRRIGYGWWRRLHYATFAVYAGAAAHGIGSGSDTGWTWSWVIYVASFAIVGALLVLRLSAKDRSAARSAPVRPRADPAARTAAGAAAVAGRARLGTSASAPQHAAGFSARLDGRLRQRPNADGAVLVQLDGALHSGFDGDFQLRIHGRMPAGAAQLEVIDNRVWLRGRDGTVWSGRVGLLDGWRLRGEIVAEAAGARPLVLEVDLFRFTGEAMSGTVRASPARAGAETPVRPSLAI